MREIKYRGYNGLEWLYTEMIRYDSEDDSWQMMNHETDEWDYVSFIGQYTGLKDKNEVEIYRGDIVKTYNGDKGVVKLGEYQDEEILDYHEEYYIDCDGEERKTVGFFVEHLNGECVALDNRTDKWIEIIGNIYENPELLEVR